MDFPSNDSYFSLLNLSFVENCHISIFTTFAKQSMINRLSNAINCNRLAAKFSKVMSSNDQTQSLSVMKNKILRVRLTALELEDPLDFAEVII